MNTSLLEKDDEDPGGGDKISKKSVGLERVRVSGLVGVMVQKAKEQKADFTKQVAAAIERCTTLFATTNETDLEKPKNALIAGVLIDGCWMLHGQLNGQI